MNTLPAMIKNSRKSLIKDDAFEALLTGPCKMFDCLNFMIIV